MADVNEKSQANELDHVETVHETVLGTPVDDMLSTLVAQDNIPWFRKPNLRKLYLLFIGSVLCIETTSGYDASVVNGLQAVPKWNQCTSNEPRSLYSATDYTDFHSPKGTTLGLIGSMYALGVSSSPL